METIRDTVNILAVGDVTTHGGVEYLGRRLRRLKQELAIDFCVVNGENAAGRGLTPADADDIFAAGADVITLGNHAYSKREIANYLDDNRYILRPLNYAESAWGRGDATFDTSFGAVRVITVVGRVGMDYAPDNPFHVIQHALEQNDCAFTLVEIHAEATSEKQAMAYYLDGKVSVVWGTHTHVQTADARVLPGGTGFITDLGMTGPVNGVIGMDVEQSVNMFLGIPKDHYRGATGECRLDGAVFTLERSSGRCVEVSAIQV
jgi:metallophosphoesterase (TIGR00282 family)